MFHNYFQRQYRGFGLLELVLSIGLLMIALPMIWMIISFITHTLLQLTTSLERDRTTYLIVMTLDRCVSVSRDVVVTQRSIILSSPLTTCIFEMDFQQQMRISINDQERIFSKYQSRIRFQTETDEGKLPQTTVTFSDGSKDLFMYSLYDYEMPNI